MTGLDRDLLLSHFDERTLPDGCVWPTDLAGWGRVLDSLRASEWRVEGASCDDLGTLFSPDSEQATIKVFVGSGQVQVNVFPLEPTSIHFDFAVAELVDQDAVDLLVKFIRLCSKAANARCDLSPEGVGTSVVASYDPTTDAFMLCRGDSPSA